MYDPTTWPKQEGSDWNFSSWTTSVTSTHWGQYDMFQLSHSTTQSLKFWKQTKFQVHSFILQWLQTCNQHFKLLTSNIHKIFRFFHMFMELADYKSSAQKSVPGDAWLPSLFYCYVAAHTGGPKLQIATRLAIWRLCGWQKHSPDEIHPLHHHFCPFHAHPRPKNPRKHTAPNLLPNTLFPSIFLYSMPPAAC